MAAKGPRPPPDPCEARVSLSHKRRADAQPFAAHTHARTHATGCVTRPLIGPARRPIGKRRRLRKIPLRTRAVRSASEARHTRVGIKQNADHPTRLRFFIPIYLKAIKSPEPACGCCDSRRKDTHVRARSGSGATPSCSLRVHMRAGKCFGTYTSYLTWIVC